MKTVLVSIGVAVATFALTGWWMQRELVQCQADVAAVAAEHQALRKRYDAQHDILRRSRRDLQAAYQELGVLLAAGVDLTIPSKSVQAALLPHETGEIHTLSQVRPAWWPQLKADLLRLAAGRK